MQKQNKKTSSKEEIKKQGEVVESPALEQPQEQRRKTIECSKILVIFIMTFFYLELIVLILFFTQCDVNVRNIDSHTRMISFVQKTSTSRKHTKGHRLANQPKKATQDKILSEVKTTMPVQPTEPVAVSPVKETQQVSEVANATATAKPVEAPSVVATPVKGTLETKKIADVATTVNSAEKTTKTVKVPEPLERKVAFDEKEYLPYAKPGKAQIKGKLCFELDDKSTKCFANVDVFVNPVTNYSNEWYERAWAGREALQTADKRAFNYNQVVKSKKDGSFEFKKLAPGSYYVATSVCLPKTKDAKTCATSRFATKVKMKNLVNATLKKVFP